MEIMKIEKRAFDTLKSYIEQLGRGADTMLALSQRHIPPEQRVYSVSRDDLCASDYREDPVSASIGTDHKQITLDTEAVYDLADEIAWAYSKLCHVACLIAHGNQED